MKDFNKHKVIKFGDYTKKGRVISSLSLRASFSNVHNANSPEHRLDRLWNFSIWVGQPHHDKISIELFIVKHKPWKIPRIYLTNWNRKRVEC